MEQQFACYLDGAEAGAVKMSRQGLYWKVEAETDLRSGEMLRAYVRTRAGEEPLGVMVPQRGKLRASRMIPASRFAPEQVVRCEARRMGGEEQWTPWSGEIQGYPVEQAKTRQIGKIQEVAIPYRTDAPFPMVPLFCFFHLQTIDEEPYLVIRLDEAGWPIL